jgi:hypothetical protein
VARECASSGSSVDSEAKTLWVQSGQEIARAKALLKKGVEVVENLSGRVKIKLCDILAGF